MSNPCLQALGRYYLKGLKVSSQSVILICNVGVEANKYNVTSVNYQLDLQFFYFIIRLLQSSTCFEQRRAHHQEVKLY